jgi:hypothetical protein
MRQKLARKRRKIDVVEGLGLDACGLTFMFMVRVSKAATDDGFQWRRMVWTPTFRKSTNAPSKRTPALLFSRAALLTRASLRC